MEIDQEKTKCKELVMYDWENKYIECSARNDKSTMVALNIANARNKQHGFPIKWQCTGGKKPSDIVTKVSKIASLPEISSCECSRMKKPKM